MKRDLRAEGQRFADKLSKIKIALFDVDGILTDSKVYWDGEERGFNRSFNTYDGYGLKTLQRAGLKVGIITGGDSLGVRKRFEGLGVDYMKMGTIDKRQGFKEIMNDCGYALDEALYMGDEFFDLPILKQVGFAATAPHASHEIQESVDYVTQREGGDGCVREVIDMLRYVQNIVPQIEY
jgi:3-deoxy-D-manno-octulosonate 8-phosphate phosphatase (KDO 8-P phosphatase)